MGGDAGNQGAQNQRGNDGLDQAQKDVTEDAQAHGEGRSIRSQFAARDHGPKNPGHQRTTSPGSPCQHQQTG
jgi:hypothetical protein